MRDFLKHRFITLDKQSSVFTYILKCFIYLFLKDLESEIFASTFSFKYLRLLRCLNHLSCVSISTLLMLWSLESNTDLGFTVISFLCSRFYFYTSKLSHTRNGNSSEVFLEKWEDKTPVSLMGRLKELANSCCFQLTSYECHYLLFVVW